MRIRKRSISALSNLSREKAEVSCSSREEERMMKEKEFLLPLVKAAMDVQAQAQAHFGENDGRAIAQIQSRPLHKWRNALLRCTCSTQSHALQESGECDKPFHKWDGIIRKTGGDRFRLGTGEGGCEKKAVDVGAAVKKQRSKSNCTRICHASEERKISPRMKGNEEKADEDNKKVLEDRSKKVLEDNKNTHAGSQCRRRNGRGWRCSERTLVGYHLCEHHLGKGRLRSINNSAAKVVGNGKGAKFKDLKLIHAAAGSASASPPV